MQVFSRNRDASLLELYPKCVDIKKFSHAEPFCPGGIRRRGKSGVDAASFHRRDNLRQAAHLNNGDVGAALEAETLEKNHCPSFTHRAESRDPEFFSFELLRRFDFRPRVDKADDPVKRAGYDPHVGPRQDRPGSRDTGCLRELDFTCDQRLSSCDCGNIDELRFDAVFGEVPTFLCYPSCDMSSGESRVAKLDGFGKSLCTEA